MRVDATARTANANKAQRSHKLRRKIINYKNAGDIDDYYKVCTATADQR
jgi:hypothetical protein